MKRKNNVNVEAEVRSSHIYKTLSGSGNEIAGKIADGLGKASHVIDGVVDDINRSIAGGSNGSPNPNTNQTQPFSTTQNGKYQYQYKTGSNTGNQGSGGVPPYNKPHKAPKVPPTPVQPPNYYYSRPKYAPPRAQAQSAQNQNTKPPSYVPPVVQQVQTSNNKQTPVRPVSPPQMKMVRKSSSVKYFMTGIVSLVYAASTPMYEPRHFFLFAAVVLSVFMLSSLIFRGKKTFVPVEPEAVKPVKPVKPTEEEKPAKTGNEEIDKIIADGNDYISKLRAANEAIPEESVSECIDRMVVASREIFNSIADNPLQSPQIRKFMNYYLPTTLKLLDSYSRLSKHAVKGENVTATLVEIERILYTIADAFEKQLDSLFSDEALDISTDISVFETMLKQEGFVEDEKFTQ